jgi:hypothetical protein
MTLDHAAKGKVNIKMIDFVEKLLLDLPEEFEGEAPTPAANHLFAVNEDAPKVDEKRAQFFTPMLLRLCSYASVPDPTYRQLSPFCASE